MKRCTNILNVIPHIIKKFKGKKEIHHKELVVAIMILTGWKRPVCDQWIKELGYMKYIRVVGINTYQLCNGEAGNFKNKNQNKLEMKI